MKKAFLAIMITAIVAFGHQREAEAACTPAGYCPFIGCIGWYNWAANPSFQDGSSCWSLSGAVSIKNDGQMCTATPYAQFGLAYPSARLSQVTHIAGPGQPGYDSNLSNNFAFDYRFQLNDPQHDSFGVVVTLALYNNANNTLLQWIATHTGGQSPISCGVQTLNFTNANLIGKDVRIEITARNIYTNTIVRVTGIALWQKPIGAP